MARAVTTQQQDRRHGRRLGRRAADLLPDPLHDHHHLQVGDRGDPGLQPDPVRHAGELSRGAGAERLLQAVHELGDPLGRLDHPGACSSPFRRPGRWPSRRPSRTKDILMWMLSTKMMPAVAVLFPIYLIFRDTRPARQPHRPDRHADADQPADRGVDALHLLPRNSGRDPGGGAHGRRLAVGRDRLCADADGGAGHRLDHAAQHHPGLERGVLDDPPDHHRTRRR